MSCNGADNSLENRDIKNPNIQGGVSTGQTLVAPDITGGVNLDDATAYALSRLLAPHLPAILGAIFKNCEGNDLPAGTQLMSCSEVDSAIEKALCDAGLMGGDADRITNFLFNTTTKELQIFTRYNDGTTQTWQVDLSSLTPSPPIQLTTAPMATPTTETPLNVFGGVQAFMGMPVTWGSVYINGIPYRIPLYTGA